MTSNTTNEVVFVQKPGKGFAITALVFGILGAVLGTIPLLSPGALLFGVLGLVFGILGLLRARKVKVGKAMSITASVLSLVAIVLAVIGLNVMTNATNKLVNDLKSPTASVSMK